jgi:iron complex transport system substrate-binding protein
LALGGCAPAPQAKLSDKGPSLVSLNPCTDALVAELADPQQILALSAYSSNPASSSMDLGLARQFRRTNGAVEEVLALHPDLVVSGNFTPPATRAAFASLGLRLEEVPVAPTVAASEAQIRRLAQLTGHPDRGEALIARIEAALTAAAPLPGTPAIPALVWESGGIVAGHDTLIAELLRRTGFADFAAAKGLHQADVLPLERLLADPPQLILVAGSLHAQEDRLLAHPALAALKDTRRAALNPALLWCGGLTIIPAVQRLKVVRTAVESNPMERRP